ncbi:MAG: hypothetical protein LUH36_05885 [Oscillospiraceae bacterium]|nr:hypothetical protein [Oscillospiraceae bacterium]
MRTECPLAWRKAWSLYRRQEGTDSYGDPTAVYDMDSPDYTAEAGTEGAVCWQITDDQAVLQLYGEGVEAVAEGVLYDSALEIEPFDRAVFEDGVWEIRAVTPWLGHRELKAVRVS